MSNLPVPPPHPPTQPNVVVYHIHQAPPRKLWWGWKLIFICVCPVWAACWYATKWTIQLCIVLPIKLVARAINKRSPKEFK